VSSGRGGGGHLGERAGRGARPRAHSPAARAFLLAFSAPFLPRAHYQWSPASDLRRFAGFTLAPPSPPSALQAAALAGEGAGGGAPTGGAGRQPEGPGWEGLAPLTPASGAALREGISRGGVGAPGARGLSPATGSGWQAEKGVGTSACPPPPRGSRRYQAFGEDDGHYSRTYWTLGPSVRPSSRCSWCRGPPDAGPRSYPRAPPKVSAWSAGWARRRPRGGRPCCTPAGRQRPSASSPPGLASVQRALGTAGSVEAGVVCLAASASSWSFLSCTEACCPAQLTPAEPFPTSGPTLGLVPRGGGVWPPHNTAAPTQHVVFCTGGSPISWKPTSLNLWRAGEAGELQCQADAG